MLQEVPDARYDRSTSGVQYNTGANLIPLPDRTKTKTQSATPAPSDLPKETCFFWYHGACRRGDDCDRFHETDPTWPISPPPGFRHYQPCILPLCPLRTDQESTKKPQVYQRRDRTMGGQADGAAFSRATTAGESPSVSDSTNTDTDMSEASEKLSTISLDAIVARDVQDGVVTQTPAEDTCKEGVIPDGEVKARQDLGSNEFDQSDYIDLSQLLSPPSTPIVQEETLLSISHPGTLRKRCPLRATESSYSSHKRIKLAESTPLDLSNFVSILERPRDMSQWDVRLPGYSLSHLTHMHSFPPQPSPVVAVNTEPTTFKLQPFDPPKGPRSSGTEPPICFFYYHKGYCKPKRGRRCDYLHNTNTPQQTVSLPLGIDNHDPTCSLPLCPVRIQSLGQLGQESKHFPANTQSLIEHEGTTHRRLSNSLAHGRPSPSPRGITTDVQRRHPRGMLDLALLKLPGVLRQRRKEQTRKIEQIQMDQGISFNIDAEARARAKKRMRRKQRRSQKQAGEDVTESLRPQMQEEDSNRQVLNNQPNTSTTQRRLLPSLAVEEEASTSAFLSPAGVEGLLQIQPPGELWPRGSIQSERIWGIKPEIAYKSHPSSTVQGFSSSLETSDVLPAPLQQVLSNGNLDMVSTVNEYPRKAQSLVTDSQSRPSALVVSHEYSQECLGLTT